MNKKLIAVAVSAAVMAPVASQADVTVYGRINNGLDFTDDDRDADSKTDVSAISSRFGIRASADVGNGMTASARYEFATRTDREQENITDLRIGTVGLTGNFGSVTIGNQWSAFYDTVGTHIDPTYTLGYYLYSSIVGGPYRASNTIKYANSFGPVYLEVDVRLNDSDEGNAVAEKINGDGVGIGASWAVTDNITLAAAFDSEDASVTDGTPDVDRTGLAARGQWGNWFGSLGWQETDPDTPASTAVSQTQVWFGGNFGEKTTAMIGYGATSVDGSTSEPTLLNLGVYYKLGGGMRLWYEGAFLDRDAPAGEPSADLTRHILGMRIDF